jgi:hypothetical protein
MTRWRSTGLHGALHVVGNQVVAAVEGAAAWATRMRLMAARGLAPSSSVGHSRVRRGQRQDVAIKLRLDADGAHLGAGGGQQALGNGRDGASSSSPAPGAGVVPLQNLQLLRSLG